MLLHALPIFHTHGLFVATNVVLVAGASMIFLPKFDPDEVFELLPRATAHDGRADLLRPAAAGPAPRPAKRPRHMRLFVSGSAPLLAETHREWRERTGHAILERYGMTETNMNTSNPYDGERVAGTVGFPLPGVEVRVADPETGKALGARRDRHDRGQGPERLQGLLAHARRRPRPSSAPTASSSPATSARSTRAAMSTSSGAART